MEYTSKSDLPKIGDVEGSWQPPPDSYSASAVQIVSTIIFNRLYSRLHHAQSEDQGGFRTSFQTLDHFATYRLLEQECREWRVATVDFMKVFDSISHQSLWTSLVCFLGRDYTRNRKGSVLTDKESDMFEIKRGTKQCDSLCSLLFNTNGTERRCSIKKMK